MIKGKIYSLSKNEHEISMVISKSHFLREILLEILDKLEITDFHKDLIMMNKEKKEISPINIFDENYRFENFEKNFIINIIFAKEKIFLIGNLNDSYQKELINTISKNYEFYNPHN